ncbi:hypothetical protein POM88_021371 [Heracleum sosnowskyi]|uniref:CCHC-type domain-containing protein n=1 Tax=Heracleum sosnowskyi TaxID=360622 RepID=A0AAD8IEQ3_9APIA|nr:hypothetical protein POM88_021371 [Heracleum sosnowskyi]
MVEEKDPPEVPASPAPVAAMNAQKSTTTQSITGSSKPTTSNEEAVASDTAYSPVKEEAKNPPGQDAVLEESIRVTRGRLRQTCTSISDNMFCGAVGHWSKDCPAKKAKKAVVGAQANTVLATTNGPKVNMVVGEVVASGTNDGVME